MFPDPTFIIKRELMWIPLFGWCCWKADMIPVDRGAGKKTLVAIRAGTRAALAQGRQIIVFPEGTRRPAGAAPDYKSGVAHLYVGVNATCLPVALNSGLFWPRRKFLRHPGTIVVEFLDPIAPGLRREEFLEAPGKRDRRGHGSSGRRGAARPGETRVQDRNLRQIENGRPSIAQIEASPRACFAPTAVNVRNARRARHRSIAARSQAGSTGFPDNERSVQDNMLNGSAGIGDTLEREACGHPPEGVRH